VGVVVVGHWLMAAVVWRRGELTADNTLELVPATQWLTWAFQVVPVFFLVGGWANAVSWRRASGAGRTHQEWLAARTRRLVGPLLPLAVAWALADAALDAVGVNRDLLHLAGRVAAQPAWFLAAYLVVVALTPLAVRGQARLGLRLVLALGLAGAVVDVMARGLGVPAVGWLNFAVVWLLCHQLGIAWEAGDLGRGLATHRTGIALATGGLVTLVAMTSHMGYARSMVGGLESDRSNTSPPTMALAAVGLWQAGLVLVLREPLDRWVRQSEVRARLRRTNELGISLYLWHLSALALGCALLLATGLFPQPDLASPAWWGSRPLWLLALAAVLALLLRMTRRLRTWRPIDALASVGGRSPSATSGLAPASPVRTGAGVAVIAGTVAALAGLGLEPAPLPVVAIVSIQIGFALAFPLAVRPARGHRSGGSVPSVWPDGLRLGSGPSGGSDDEAQ